MLAQLSAGIHGCWRSRVAKGYHCDKHKIKDMKLLMERLDVYNSDAEEAKHVSINLFL